MTRTSRPGLSRPRLLPPASPRALVLLVLAVACARAPTEPPRAPAESPVPSTSPVVVALARAAPPPRSEAELQAALAADLDDILAYEELARLYHARSKTRPSYLLLTRQLLAQAFAALARRGNDSPALRLTRALVAIDRGDLDAARGDLDAGLALAPKDPDLLRACGLLALRAHQFERARDVLEDLSRTPSGKDDPDVWIALGVALAARGQFRGAEQAYRHAVELAPHDHRAFYNLGLLYLRIASSDDVDTMEFEKLATTAKYQFVRYIDLTRQDNDRPEAQRARDLVAGIDQLIGSRPRGNFAELQKKALELEEQARRQEAEERARLLELERQYEADEAAGTAGATSEQGRQDEAATRQEPSP